MIRVRPAARLLIGGGALLAAVGTGMTAWAASQANGKWQDSTRAQVRYTMSTVENARAVYFDDAALALQLQAVLIQAEELERRIAPKDQQSILRIQAAADRATISAYLKAYGTAGAEANPLLSDPRYAPVGGDPAPQVGKRLADAQAQNPATAAKITALVREGDRAANLSQRAGWVMIGGAIAVVLGTMLWARSDSTSARNETGSASTEEEPIPATQNQLRAQNRGTPVPSSPLATGALLTLAFVSATFLAARRWFPLSTAAGITRGCMLVMAGLVIGTRYENTRLASMSAPATGGTEPLAPPARAPEEPPTAPLAPPGLPASPAGLPTGRGPRSRFPPLPVILGLIATVVTVLQIQASTEENRWLATAARGASLISGAAVGGVILDAFETNGRQAGLLMGQGAEDLRRAARVGKPDARTPAETIAAADGAAADRIVQLAISMGRTPTVADGVDASTRTIVAGSPFEQQALQSEQTAAVNQAEAAGRRSNWLVLGLFLITVLGISVEIRAHIVRSRAATASTGSRAA